MLPAPHQIFVELWDTTVNKAVTSKRSLVYHAWITLSATLLGFGIGTVLGVTLAIGIVTSMFTAITVTRAIVQLVYGRRRVARLSI